MNELEQATAHFTREHTQTYVTEQKRKVNEL